MKKQIIGIDWASGQDVTCASSFCGNCKRLLRSEINSDPNKIQVTMFKSCPHCGTRFKRHIVQQ